jgi:uncharacterized 2Fe-2S/4Fe-4S cluster protein (DUF4445 family)
MAEDTRESFRVSFGPENKVVSVPKGSTILEACRLAGIPIDAVCGGDGKCGRCKVKPKGEFTAQDSPFLSKAEKELGIALACLSTVGGDLSVEILPRARLGRHQILTKSIEELPKPISPWVSKRYIELLPATVSDNLADLERVMREIDMDDLCAPLETLRQLSSSVRSDGWKLTATISRLERIKEISRTEPGDTSDRLLGIAVDIGTTTVVVDLVDLISGKVIGTASDYNRQTSRGEDVIARMMYSEEKGVAELRHLVRETINLQIGKLIRNEEARFGRETSANDIAAVSVAGNTVMTHFFTGLDTRHLRREPYVPVAYHMPCIKADEVGLSTNPAARVLLLPARAGYVGGDVIADVLASGMHRSSELALLIDVGTNGEIVLGGKDWLATCSCSAGPAFEGGEVSCGMRAMEGAIDKLRINEDLSTAYHVIGDERPAGICGSGLIDLVAEMYARGVIDRKARIQDSGGDRIRRADSGLEYVIEIRSKLGMYATSDLTVTDADLQNLLRTKAAVFAACSVLLRKTGEHLDKLSSIIIAGGFGYHLDIARAVTIGMFPDVPLEKYRFIGNGSLAGARLALISAKRRKEIKDIFERMTYFELSVDNDFYDEFSSALFIPHTDLKRFPSAVSDPQSGEGRP